MTVCCCYRLNHSEHWCVTGVWNLWVGRINRQSPDWLSTGNSRRNAFAMKFSILNFNLQLYICRPSNTNQNPDWINVCETQLDKLTMVQLQAEDCSLLDIKLPQHFPGSYSQRSLMKAITQNGEKHLAWHIESNSPLCIVLKLLIYFYTHCNITYVSRLMNLLGMLYIRFIFRLFFSPVGLQSISPL